MKKMILASSVLATSVAFAGDYKINLEGRADLVMNTNKTTAVSGGTTTTTKDTSFKQNAIRLNMVGTVNDSLTYRFRYRFTQNETDTARDASTNMLDYLYVDHKNSLFTTRFGKQNWSEAFGRESALAATDTIISSAANANYGSAVGTYRFGVSAMFKLMDAHNLTIAISNPNKTATASSGNYKNNSTAYGVYYNSSLLDKMFQPVFGYTVAPQDGDTEAAAGSRTKKGNYTLLAFGLKSEVSGVTIDADYKTFTKANRNDGSNTAAVKETTKSMYANVSYAVDSFIPFVSYINDKYTKENTASADYKKDSLALGLMYKPFADVNFRYHLVYTSATTKYSSTTATNSKVQDSNVVFGIKADI